MRACILCGKQTNGSIGAAGIKWGNICQPCKDSEDNALSARLKLQAQTAAAIWDALDKRLYS